MNIKNKTKIVNVKDIKPYPKNAKIHTPAQVEQIKKSIEKYDYIQPICVDKNNVIVIGHGRYEAIKDIDEKLEVVDLSYLKPKEIKKLRILDNKLISAEWDKQALQDEIEAIYKGFDDLDTIADELAIDEKELSSLVPELETDGDDDIPEDVKSITKLGDLWELGKHRLLCGDSINEDDVNRLMDGRRADLCFTSPPYNANTKLNDGDIFNDSKSKQLYKNNKDNKISSDYIDFCKNIMDIIFKNVEGYIFWNVSYNANSRFEYIAQIEDKIKYLVEQICWRKSSAVPIKNGMRRAWEPIYLFSTNKKTYKFREVYSNVWEISNQNVQHKDHKACFPVELPRKAIDMFEFAKIVIEPFCGSGSTLIACEKTKRICYGMELDEHYCDVIVQRYIDFCKKNDIKIDIKHNGKKYST
jgi:DNA modification methylase